MKTFVTLFFCQIHPHHRFKKCNFYFIFSTEIHYDILFESGIQNKSEESSTNKKICVDYSIVFVTSKCEAFLCLTFMDSLWREGDWTIEGERERRG